MPREPRDVDAVLAALVRAGGVAARATLVAAAGRTMVDRALRQGSIIVVRRGWYALPEIDDAIRVAHAAGGVLCLESAALHHGWAVKSVPDVPHVILARGRVVSEALAPRAHWHRADLHSSEVVDGVATSKQLTLEQCLRSLPGDAALAVADSAARAGESVLLRTVAASARGRGAARVRSIARRASAEAANPFESVLREICHRVDGLHVVPQVLITSVDPWVRPDLVDRDLRVVIEADSFEFHGERSALRADARRYDLLVADGWIVLRFAWEDVMYDQAFVERVLRAVVELVNESTKRHCACCRAA